MRGRHGARVFVALLALLVMTVVNTSAEAQQHYLGCYKDASARDLSGYRFQDRAMTIARCTATCASRGFAYAGLQYTHHCFCDNDYGAYGEATNCNMSCSGNAQEVCGGQWANSVYATAGSGQTGGGTAGTSYETGIDRPGSDYRHFAMDQADPRLCQNACTAESQCKAWTYVRPGIQGPQAQCWLKNSVPPIRSSDCCASGVKAGAGGATAGAGGGGNTGGVAPIGPGDWTDPGFPGTLAGSDRSLGCFKDNTDRDLSGYTFHESGMTVELCRNTCASRNFAYAGVQYGTYCFCDNDYGRYGAATNCNVKCAGNTQQTCGGQWANTVYPSGGSGSGGITPAGPPAPPAGPAPGAGDGTPVGPDGLLGCFRDKGQPNGLRDRDLDGYMVTDAAMTIQLCGSTCAGRGFAYAGVQYGTYCYCGNTYGSVGPATNCMSRCGGDRNQTCGGTWANNVYIASAAANASSATPAGGGGNVPGPATGWINAAGRQDCISGGSVVSGGLSCVAPAFVPDQGLCADPRTLQLIDAWLSRTIPWQGAQLDCWGRWYGIGQNGARTINNCQRPDTDGRSRCQYVLELLNGTYSNQVGRTLLQYIQENLR